MRVIYIHSAVLPVFDLKLVDIILNPYTTSLLIDSEFTNFYFYALHTYGMHCWDMAETFAL
jgi:hypothetical protein